MLNAQLYIALVINRTSVRELVSLKKIEFFNNLFFIIRNELWLNIVKKIHPKNTINEPQTIVFLSFLYVSLRSYRL